MVHWIILPSQGEKAVYIWEEINSWCNVRHKNHVIPNPDCLVCLFDLILYVPVNNFQLCRDGSTSTKQGLMCLAQGHSTDTGEARTRNPLISRQALYH